MWCMILSCTHEVAGYIARVILWMNPWNFGAFITQISTLWSAKEIGEGKGADAGNSCYHAGARVLLCGDICYAGTEVRW
jgi:hypothetical protein